MAEKTTAYPFLPPTHGGGRKDTDDPGYSFKGSPGLWQSDSQMLSLYPQDMNVGKIEVESKLLTSIPDVWGRMHLFCHALLTPHHPSHEDVHREWRGLLGVICLAQTLNVQMRYITVNLPEAGEQPAPGIRGPLTEMVPHEYCRRLTLILADGELIGASSPYTFVFTPPSYNTPLAVPWRCSPDNRLGDAVGYLQSRSDGTSRHLLAYLKSWALDLSKRTGDLALTGADPERLSKLFEKNWAESIKVKAEPIDTQYLDNSLYVAPQVSIAGLKGLRFGDEQLSGLLIKASFLKDPKIAKVPLVVWEDGWREKTSVWGPYLTTEVPFPEGSHGGTLLNGKIEHPWINPAKLFFTETITKVQMSSGAGCKNGDRFLLPLRKEIFDYFSSAFLREHFELDLSTDGTATAILKIPLSGGGNAIVKQEYPSNKQNQVITRDAAVIWPDVALPDWQHYYLFARSPERGDGHWTCEPVGAKILDESIAGEDKRSHIWRLDRPPEAVLFRQGERTAGVCIPKWTDTPNVAGDTWLISIDFGTTSTSVAVRIDNTQSEAARLNFKPHHLTLMSLPDAPSMQFILNDQFITNVSRFLESPFPSVYEGTGQREGSKTPQPIIHGRVPFEQTYFRLHGDYGRYSTRLKWETTADSVRKVNGFLSQVILMALLEARASGIRNVGLRWTYPSAFEASRRKRFEQTWRVISKDIGASTGFGTVTEPTIQLPPAKEDGDPTFTESVAVCQYARKFHTFTPGGESLPHMTLDIGGGTTDVGIWLGGRLVLQSSILIAADVMAKFIRRHEPFQCFLLDVADISEATDRSVWQRAMKHDTNYGCAVNYYFRLHDQNREVSNAVVKAALSQNEVTKGVSLALFLMGGITFYGGTLLHAACRNEIADGSLTAAGADVLYCGSGARLLRWLGDESSFQPLMASFLSAGLEVPFGSRRDVQISKHQKLEDSMGILHPFDTEGAIPEPSVIVGERGVMFGQSIVDALDDFAAMTAKRPLPAIRFTGDIPILKRFVAHYNQEAAKMDLVEIPSDFAYEKIVSSIQDEYFRFTKKPEDTPTPAAFVTGLIAMTQYFIDGRV